VNRVRPTLHKTVKTLLPKRKRIQRHKQQTFNTKNWRVAWYARSLIARDRYVFAVTTVMWLGVRTEEQRTLPSSATEIVHYNRPWTASITISNRSTNKSVRHETYTTNIWHIRAMFTASQYGGARNLAYLPTLS